MGAAAQSIRAQKSDSLSLLYFPFISFFSPFSPRGHPARIAQTHSHPRIGPSLFITHRRYTQPLHCVHRSRDVASQTINHLVFSLFFSCTLPFLELNIAPLSFVFLCVRFFLLLASSHIAYSRTTHRIVLFHCPTRLENAHSEDSTKRAHQGEQRNQTSRVGSHCIFFFPFYSIWCSWHVIFR